MKTRTEKAYCDLCGGPMPDRCIPSNAQKGIIEAGGRQWRIQVARYQQGAEIGGRKPGFRLFNIFGSKYNDHNG